MPCLAIPCHSDDRPSLQKTGIYGVDWQTGRRDKGHPPPPCTVALRPLLLFFAPADHTKGFAEMPVLRCREMWPPAHHEVRSDSLWPNLSPNQNLNLSRAKHQESRCDVRTSTARVEPCPQCSIKNKPLSTNPNLSRSNLGCSCRCFNLAARKVQIFTVHSASGGNQVHPSSEGDE